MIPKIIHFIWLSKKNKPKSFDLALEQISKYAPDFEVKIWTEKKMSNFALPQYFYKLLSEKRWALASDIYRLHVLQKEGGVYFDTDQILVAGINDLLDNQMFISKYHEVDNYYGFGLLGVSSQHAFLKRMIDFYDTYNDDKYIIVNKIGSDIINNILEIEKLKVEKSIKILGQDYFYPLTKDDYTENTRSYHMANTSWIPLYKKILFRIPFYLEIKNIFKKYLPEKIKSKIFKTDYL